MNRQDSVRRLLLTAAMCAGGAVFCSDALAAERETVTFSNVNSDGQTGAASNVIKSATFSGTYGVRRIRMSGLLTQLNIDSYEDDAMVEVQPPGSSGWISIEWSADNEFPDAVAADGELYFDLPDIVSASGTWKFRFSESDYDEAGIDARWTSVTFALDDGVAPPPPTIDLGALGHDGVHRSDSLDSDDVNWYRFELTRPLSETNGTYMEIYTAGSQLDFDADEGEYPDDTAIALYDSNGWLVASNDDNEVAPDERWSLLQFGAYSPHLKELPAGVYYLAVSASSWFAESGNFDAWSYSSQSGTVQVHILSNAFECTPPTITEPPTNQSVDQGADVVFSCAATGSGTLSYQWLRNGITMTDEPGHISGASTSTLTIFNARTTDEAVYTVVVSGECESSASATLEVRCLADFNRDGFVNGDDFDGFAAAFEEADHAADFNGDGFVNGDDYDAFSEAFDNPSCIHCPPVPVLNSPVVNGPTSVTVSWQAVVLNVTEYVVEASLEGGPFAEIGRVAAPGTSFVATDLVPDRDYCFRVRACGEDCCSDESESKCVHTPETEIPAAPSGLSTSDVWDDKLDLHWRDNSSNETEFKVERKVGNAWVLMTTAGTNSTVRRVTGLAPSTDYVLRVTASNAAGSRSSKGILVRTAPARPTNIRVTDIGILDAIVRWDDVSSDESGFTIWLDRWTPGGWVRERTIDNPANDQGRHVSPPDLLPGTLYRAAVRSYRNDGTRSGISSWVEFTTDTGIPANPSNLRTDNLWPRTVDLRWNDNSGNEIDFYLARSLDGVNWDNVAIVPGGSGTEKVVRIEGLHHLTRYYFKVRARSSYGFSDYSNVLQVDTPNEIPDAPTGLTAVNIFRMAIDLQWLDNADNETKYRLAYSTDGGVTWNNIGGDLAAQAGSGGWYTYRAQPLSPNTNYWFRVRCGNDLGWSDYSNVIGPIKTKP